METVKYYEKNSVGEDYVIGDLHGCYDLFLKLLKIIKFDKSKDRMFSVGDLVDRGPRSLECIQLIRENWFHSVRGNHEQMMIDTLSSRSLDNASNWMYNGGGWILDVVSQHGMEFAYQLAKEANDLPYIIVIDKNSEDRVNIVHAEFLGFSDSDIDTQQFPDTYLWNFIWGRNVIKMEGEYDCSSSSTLSISYVGHTPQKQIVKKLRHVFIDTAAVYGGALTCVKLSNNEIMEVKNEIIQGRV